MKKIILEIIEYCNDCPYRYLRTEGHLCTNHDDSEDMMIDREVNNEKVSIPKWCPLDDYKDLGVKVAVTALIVRNDKILLGLRGESCETGKNTWAYPGGRIDYGEDPFSSLIREIKEETGMIAQKKDLKFFSWNNEFFPDEKKHYISMTFLVKNIIGEPKITEPDHCKEWRWFDPDDLPNNIFWAAEVKIKEYKDRINNG